ncbi:type 1 fimbrial protein [Burkholderia sp. AU31624]|uniref:fimbrial protein n=1 Tax=Burkholderia sp. AU31624 TaxID=2879629 RepID=UPI001CF33E0E|nr:fimbrial protein [Burkholderia sp. AU31624]MCA8258021.1 type 1 fimbrial protein [Burkholderia sp. AU31624]
MKTIQWRRSGRVGRAVRRLAMAGYLVLAFGPHVNAQTASGSTAQKCAFSNTNASPWKMINALTSATPVDTILYQRTVSLFVKFTYGTATGEHELVGAGHWKTTPIVTDGVAKTNVNGIGFKWAGVSGNEDENTLPQDSLPMVTVKHNLGRGNQSGTENTQAMIFRQYLVLEKPASQLPEGKLVVKNLPGNPTVEIYAIDLPKGVASVGSTVTVPEQTPLCAQAITFVGAGNVCIGSECEIQVPNRCEIQSNWIKPVTLGNVAIDNFPTLNAMSEPVSFDITLSQCAAAAKPKISFRDKAAQPNPDKTLLQLSAPAGRSVAHGFNIVMTHRDTNERIAYGEPGTAPTYPMHREADTATIPLSARYIRTGADGELRPGNANGAAEFTFTFP